MDPSYFHARFYLVTALLDASRLEEASVEFRSLPPAADQWHQLKALIEARAGRTKALRRYVAEVVRATKSGAARPDAVAQVFGWLGDKDEAFRWLERAFNEHYFYLVFLKVEPDLDPLRNDPRFAVLLRRVGLPS